MNNCQKCKDKGFFISQCGKISNCDCNKDLLERSEILFDIYNIPMSYIRNLYKINFDNLKFSFNNLIFYGNYSINDKLKLKLTKLLVFYIKNNKTIYWCSDENFKLLLSWDKDKLNSDLIIFEGVSCVDLNIFRNVIKNRRNRDLISIILCDKDIDKNLLKFLNLMGFKMRVLQDVE